MDPLARLLLRLLRIGLFFCAFAATAILALEVWKNWLWVADREMSAADYGFLAILLAVIAGSLSLARAIHRELSKIPPTGADS
jgi:hypothetical protein